MSTRTAEKTTETLEIRYRTNPDSRIFSRLADAYRKEGNITGAVEICTRGLQNHSDYITGRIILGRCFLEQEKFSEAMEEFKKVCGLDRRNQVALKMLADIFGRQGMDQKAGDLYAMLQKMDPFNRSLAHLCKQYPSSGKTNLFEILEITPAEQPPSVGETDFKSDTDSLTFEQEASPEFEELTPYQENEEQIEQTFVLDESLDDIENGKTTEIDGYDISRRMAMMFGDESGSPSEPDQEPPINLIPPTQEPGTIELTPEDQLSPDNADISGQDITSRIDELFSEQISEDSEALPRKKQMEQNTESFHSLPGFQMLGTDSTEDSLIDDKTEYADPPEDTFAQNEPDQPSTSYEENIKLPESFYQEQADLQLIEEESSASTPLFHDSDSLVSDFEETLQLDRTIFDKALEQEQADPVSETLSGDELITEIEDSQKDNLPTIDPELAVTEQSPATEEIDLISEPDQDLTYNDLTTSEITPDLFIEPDTPTDEPLSQTLLSEEEKVQPEEGYQNEQINAPPAEDSTDNGLIIESEDIPEQNFSEDDNSSIQNLIEDTDNDDVVIEHDGSAVTEMDVMVHEIVENPVLGDDVVEKLDSIFSQPDIPSMDVPEDFHEVQPDISISNNSSMFEEQDSVHQTDNEIELNNKDVIQDSIQETDIAEFESSTEQIWTEDSNEIPNEVVPDMGASFFDNEADQRTQAEAEQVGLPFAQNHTSREPEIELNSYDAEERVVDGPPTISGHDIAQRLDEFFPDDLMGALKGEELIPEDDDDVEASISEFYSIFGEAASEESITSEKLAGVEQVELEHSFECGSFMPDEQIAYQEAPEENIHETQTEATAPDLIGDIFDTGSQIETAESQPESDLSAYSDALSMPAEDPQDSMTGSVDDYSIDTLAIKPEDYSSGAEMFDENGSVIDTESADSADIDERDRPYDIPDHVLTPTLADIYFQQGQMNLAIQIYSRLLERDPDNEKLQQRYQQMQAAFEPQHKPEAVIETQTADPEVKALREQKTKNTARSGQKKKKAADSRPLAGVRIKKRNKASGKSNTKRS